MENSGETEERGPGTEERPDPAAKKTIVTGTILGLLGAAAGGAVGFAGVGWLAREGFYAIILPGALIGLGCGLMLGRRSILMGVVCAVAALVATLAAEWHYFPFVADHGLAYFLAHVHRLSRLTLILMAAGTFFGFWFGMGREGGAWWMRRSAKPRNGENK